MTYGEQRQMANKILEYLNERGPSTWTPTSRVRDHLGVGEKGHAGMRALMLRLNKRKILKRVGSGNFYWKINVKTWDSSDPFLPPLNGDLIDPDYKPEPAGAASSTVKSVLKNAKDDADSAASALKATADDIGDVLGLPDDEHYAAAGKYKIGVDHAAGHEPSSQAVLDELRELREQFQSQFNFLNERAKLAEKQAAEALKAAQHSYKTIEVKKYDGKTHKLKNVVLPEKFDRVLGLARCRRNILLVGPAGCLRGDSLIHDPTDNTTLTVEERARLARPFFVTSLSNFGELVTAVAMPPVEYQSAQMYRVLTERGREFFVTGDHQFLTSSGYVRARDAASLLQTCGEVLLPCVSGDGRLVRISDGQSFCETTEGSQGGCLNDLCFHGEQLRLSSASVRLVFPSRVCVHERNLDCLPMGGYDASRERTLHHLRFYLPSKRDFAPLFASSRLSCSQTLLESVLASSDSFVELRQRPLQSLAQCTSERLFPSVAAPIGAVASFFDSRTSLGFYATGPGLSSQSGVKHRRQSVERLETSTSLVRVNSTPLRPGAGFYGSASSSPWFTEIDNILVVEPVECQRYFDFHVPVHNNYLYNGVIHHNCGKTHMAELLAKTLGLALGSLSCTAGIGETHLLGVARPNLTTGKDRFRGTDFLKCYESGGVYLFDELDASDPNLLLCVNSALANGYCNVPNREAKSRAEQHEDFVCVATANTFCRGATRQYAGRNQLDEATLDRFRIGIVEMYYDAAVEASLCPDADLRAKLQQVRQKVEESGVRRVVSTRFVADAHIMVKNEKWTYDMVLEALTAGWTAEEKNRVLA